MLIEFLTTAALLNGVDPDLLVSMCKHESNLKNVINHSDGGSKSLGICQVKLSTAKMYMSNIQENDLMNPRINALVAAWYLRKQLDRYQGDTKCAVAAYNAGTCNKNVHGTIRNIKYLKKVDKVCENYRGSKCIL